LATRLIIEEGLEGDGSTRGRCRSAGSRVKPW